MEVSVLEAKRLSHCAVLRLSWLLLVTSVALSTLLQVAVAPPTLVGYLTAGATPGMAARILRRAQPVVPRRYQHRPGDDGRRGERRTASSQR
jgi:hypothetical protein